MIENIIWLAIQFLLTTAGALLAFRLGRAWLEVYILTCTIALFPLTGKLVPVGPLVFNAAQLLFAGMFLSTKILVEYYGDRTGYKIVRLSFFAATVFIAVSLTGLPLSSVPETQALAAGLDEVFLVSTRILVACLIAYFFSQNINVWVFEAVGRMTQRKHLWLRTNLSNIAAQTVDSTILVLIAFWGVYDNLLLLILVGIGCKVLIGILDTPIMYLTRIIKPADLAVQKGEIA